MSFNLANKTLAERAELEDEKSRLYDLWQTNLGKAKGEAARLFGERAKRKGAVALGEAPLDFVFVLERRHDHHLVTVLPGFGVVAGATAA